MSTKLTLFLSISIILISIILGALVYDKMPDQVASHWNEGGKVDGYMGKFWGVFMMPFFSIALLALFFAIPNLDPLKENIAEFRKTYNLFIFFFILFFVYVWALTIVWNFYLFNMNSAILPATGLLFILTGYMLGKAKRNWFIGIRTPWTLSSETVWDKTRQLGGKLFIASGVLAILGVFFGEASIWFMLVPVFGSTVILLVYSYLLYTKEEKA